MVALSSTVKDEKKQQRIAKKLHERLIKSLLDVIVLRLLQQESSISGYDVIALIHTKYDVTLSSGGVYSLMYSLERNNLIEGVWLERKRVYRITEKGTQTLQAILESYDKTKLLLDKILNV